MNPVQKPRRSGAFAFRPLVAVYFLWGMGSPGGKSQSPLRLLVVGTGAIGNALLPRIVRWNWDGITLLDGDRVEGRNLERQELFAPVDIGRPKVEVVAAWLRNAPIPVRITATDAFIDAGNAESIIALHDVVADCTDDAHAKRLLDHICKDYGVALVSGSVHGNQAQVLVLHAEGEGEHITRDELFQGKLGSEQDGCDMRNVPLVTIEETARRMAQLLRALVHGEPVRNGRIDLFDGKQWSAIDPPNN